MKYEWAPDFVYDSLKLSVGKVAAGQVFKFNKGDNRIYMRLQDFKQEIDDPLFVWVVDLTSGEYGLVAADKQVHLLETKLKVNMVPTPPADKPDEWDDVSIEWDLQALLDEEEKHDSVIQTTGAKGGA